MLKTVVPLNVFVDVIMDATQLITYKISSLYTSCLSILHQNAVMMVSSDHIADLKLKCYIFNSQIPQKHPRQHSLIISELGNNYNAAKDKLCEKND